MGPKEGESGETWSDESQESGSETVASTVGK
jgi:hypothetical protein